MAPLGRRYTYLITFAVTTTLLVAATAYHFGETLPNPTSDRRGSNGLTIASADLPTNYSFTDAAASDPQPLIAHTEPLQIATLTEPLSAEDAISLTLANASLSSPARDIITRRITFQDYLDWMQLGDDSYAPSEVVIVVAFRADGLTRGTLGQRAGINDPDTRPVEGQFYVWSESTGEGLGAGGLLLDGYGPQQYNQIVSLEEIPQE